MSAKKANQKETQEQPAEKKFIYVKPYVQEKVVKEEGGKFVETTPKLDEPKFRDSYKAAEVTFNKSKINGMIADIQFREDYNKTGFDINVLMVTKDHYCLVQVSLQSVMGQQLAKRLKNIDYSNKVVLEVWKNNKGYANLTVYQRDLTVEDANGVNPKVFVADAFKDVELPEVKEFKIRGKVERDNSERVGVIKDSVEEWLQSDEAATLKANADLVSRAGATDDGNDDE